MQPLQSLRVLKVLHPIVRNSEVARRAMVYDLGSGSGRHIRSKVENPSWLKRAQDVLLAAR